MLVMRESTCRVLLALIQATAPTSSINTSATLNTFSPIVIFMGRRRLAAILAADLADHSRLMERDEAGDACRGNVDAKEWQRPRANATVARSPHGNPDRT